MWQANSVCLLRKASGLTRMKMTHRQIEWQLNQWNVKAESVKRESTTVTGLKFSGKTTFWKLTFIISTKSGQTYSSDIFSHQLITDTP